MTAPALPEDVERALGASLNAAHDLGEVRYGDALFNERVDADMKAEAALRAAIAAHVAPPVSASCDDVRVAVEAEREACERIIRAYREQYEPGDDARLTLEQAEQDIRARGVKS